MMRMLVILLLAIALAACGVKRNLELPKEEKKEEQSSSAKEE